MILSKYIQNIPTSFKRSSLKEQAKFIKLKQKNKSQPPLDNLSSEGAEMERASKNIKEVENNSNQASVTSSASLLLNRTNGSNKQNQSNEVRSSSESSGSTKVEYKAELKEQNQFQQILQQFNLKMEDIMVIMQGLHSNKSDGNNQENLNHQNKSNEHLRLNSISSDKSQGIEKFLQNTNVKRLDLPLQQREHFSNKNNSENQFQQQKLSKQTYLEHNTQQQTNSKNNYQQLLKLQNEEQSNNNHHLLLQRQFMCSSTSSQDSEQIEQVPDNRECLVDSQKKENISQSNSNQSSIQNNKKNNNSAHQNVNTNQSNKLENIDDSYSSPKFSMINRTPDRQQLSCPIHLFEDKFVVFSVNNGINAVEQNSKRSELTSISKSFDNKMKQDCNNKIRSGDEQFEQLSQFSKQSNSLCTLTSNDDQNRNECYQRVSSTNAFNFSGVNQKVNQPATSSLTSTSHFEKGEVEKRNQSVQGFQDDEVSFNNQIFANQNLDDLSGYYNSNQSQFQKKYGAQNNLNSNNNIMSNKDSQQQEVEINTNSIYLSNQQNMKENQSIELQQHQKQNFIVNQEQVADNCENLNNYQDGDENNEQEFNSNAGFNQQVNEENENCIEQFVIKQDNCNNDTFVEEQELQQQQEYNSLYYPSFSQEHQHQEKKISQEGVAHELEIEYQSEKLEREFNQIKSEEHFEFQSRGSSLKKEIQQKNQIQENVDESQVYSQDKWRRQEQQNFMFDSRNSENFFQQQQQRKYNSGWEYEQCDYYNHINDIFAEYQSQVQTLTFQNSLLKQQIREVTGKLTGIQETKKDFELIVQSLKQNLEWVTSLLKKKEDDYGILFEKYNSLVEKIQLAEIHRISLSPNSRSSRHHFQMRDKHTCNRMVFSQQKENIELPTTAVEDSLFNKRQQGNTPEAQALTSAEEIKKNINSTVPVLQDSQTYHLNRPPIGKQGSRRVVNYEEYSQSRQLKESTNNNNQNENESIQHKPQMASVSSLKNFHQFNSHEVREESRNLKKLIHSPSNQRDIEFNQPSSLPNSVQSKTSADERARGNLDSLKYQQSNEQIPPNQQYLNSKQREYNSSCKNGENIQPNSTKANSVQSSSIQFSGILSSNQRCYTEQFKKQKNYQAQSLQSSGQETKQSIEDLRNFCFRKK